MPSGEDEVYDLIRNEKVEPKLLSLVRAGEWSDTGEDYFTSSRSKFLDDKKNAAVIITKWEPLALYWSKT